MLYFRFNLHRVTFSYWLLNSSACSHFCLLYLLTVKLTHLHLLTFTFPRVPWAPVLHIISLTYTYKCKWTVEAPSSVCKHMQPTRMLIALAPGSLLSRVSLSCRTRNIRQSDPTRTSRVMHGTMHIMHMGTWNYTHYAHEHVMLKMN